MKRKSFCVLFFILLSCLNGLVIQIDFTSEPKILRINKTFLQNEKKIIESHSKETCLNPLYDAREYIDLSDSASRNGFTGKGVTVAVIDTGIYPNHAVFTNNGTINWKERIIAFYDDKINGTSDKPYDVSYHGTWTASILGGNNIEYVGVASAVQFVIMKVFDYENGELVSDESKIENAVNWIINNNEKYHIKIASMSFGVKPDPKYSDEINKLHQIVKKLVDDNILVVAAAGNYGDPSVNNGEGTITAPASEKSVIAVGGVDNEGEMYVLSGKGPTQEGAIKPDVCAPSVNILGATTGKSSNSYDNYTGTSAATPFVSGLAALMIEKDKNLTPLEVKNVISLTSFRTINPKTIQDNVQGWGVIQGYAALNALEESIPISQNIELKFSLNQKMKVFCQPIVLEPNHYFFELNQLNSADAEMYLFDSKPDDYGNPILLSHSINEFSSGDNIKRMGFFTNQVHEYYLVVKLIHSTDEGDFSIKLIFDYRNVLIVGLTVINVIALVYVIKRNFDLKKTT